MEKKRFKIRPVSPIGFIICDERQFQLPFSNELHKNSRCLVLFWQYLCNFAPFQINKAYKKASKQNNPIWSENTYAMLNNLEYFAEGTEVYFLAGRRDEDIYR